MNYSNEYIGTKPNDWINIFPQWDINRNNFFHSLHGYSNMEEVKKEYPLGFSLGRVNFNDLYESLEYFEMYKWNRENIWEDEYVGNPFKIGKILFNWSLGIKLSPPIVGINNGSIVIIGGCHRFITCFLLKAGIIPIIVHQKDKDLISTKIKGLGIVWEKQAER